MNTQQSKEDTGYLFNVDILIKNDSSAQALQLLIEILNGNNQVMDFKIQSGITLGETIDKLLQSKNKVVIPKTELMRPQLIESNNINTIRKKLVQATSPTATTNTATTKGSITTNKNKQTSLEHPEDPRTWIKSCIKDNRLVRLTANRQGQHLDIPCRILNFDEEQQYVNVYHVDEKQVYSFKLNEIDSFTDK